MSFRMNSVVHVVTTLAENTANPTNPDQNKDLELGKPDDTIDYMQRAQWLRASVLGANDGLVSVASLMIGVGAASSTMKAMLVSGLAGLIAGACSMAIGEFVSVYAQYDIERTVIEKGNTDDGDENKEPLANPWLAAGASALSFSIGGLLPLLAGAFIKAWGVRLGVVCAVTSLGLAIFGAISALLGGAKPYKGSLRVLIGGWLAMLVTYGILKFFSAVLHVNISSSG
ncbi:Vacuolar iron transporter [Rhynchospora pubera]|uniref:Vacuolar iron transporter n=1 Tax=Rhynchospora pubera TaxID=906938 RepID=A0AAV8CR13_9POAL|nr:Vacuolar iron transporter [Rhynchospora pubera]